VSVVCNCDSAPPRPTAAAMFPKCRCRPLQSAGRLFHTPSRKSLSSAAVLRAARYRAPLTPAATSCHQPLDKQGILRSALTVLPSFEQRGQLRRNAREKLLAHRSVPTSPVAVPVRHVRGAVTSRQHDALACPHDHCRHSWKNATQIPAMTVRITAGAERAGGVDRRLAKDQRRSCRRDDLMDHRRVLFGHRCELCRVDVHLVASGDELHRTSQIVPAELQKAAAATVYSPRCRRRPCARAPSDCSAP